jgi:hypothetical protein
MAGSPLLGYPFTAEPSAPGTRSAPRSPPHCRFAAAGRVNAQSPLPRISSGSLLPSCGLRSPSGSYPVRIKAPCRHRLEDLTVTSGPLSLRSPATAAVYDHRLPDHRSRLATVCSARWTWRGSPAPHCTGHRLQHRLPLRFPGEPGLVREFGPPYSGFGSITFLTSLTNLDHFACSPSFLVRTYFLQSLSHSVPLRNLSASFPGFSPGFFHGSAPACRSTGGTRRPLSDTPRRRLGSAVRLTLGKARGRSPGESPGQVFASRP